MSNYSEYLKSTIQLADGTTTTGMRVDAGFHNPAHNQQIVCFECNWQGDISQTKQENAKTGYGLAMREGYVWHCPHCTEIVWQYYWKIS